MRNIPRFRQYTCGTGKEADFWSITPHINLKKSLAEVIHVDLEAELTQCIDPGKQDLQPCFSNYFEIYIHRGKNEVTFSDLRTVTISNLTEVFHPLYNITNDTSPEATLTRSNQTFSFPQNNAKGVTFAIRSRGACGSIFRMKMYYYYCKEIFINGLKFENTISPADGFKTVVAKNCSKNYISSIRARGDKTITALNGYCSVNGTWSVPGFGNQTCLCVEGYTLEGGSCKGNITSDHKQFIIPCSLIIYNFAGQPF